MNAWLLALVNNLQHPSHIGALVAVLIESFIVLAVAGVCCLFWRRAAAATKHLIWFLSLASLPLLLCFTFPHPWLKPLWSVSTGFNPGNQVSLSISFPLEAKGGNLSSSAPFSAAGAKSASSTGNASQQAFVARFSASWLMFALLLWAAGAIAGLMAMIAGTLQLRRVTRRAASLADHDWTLLLREACEKLGLPRPITLLQSTDNLMPVTWGWWRPIVLLPAEATNWPLQRRQVVLLHELAHVKRWDSLTQTVARMNCAFFWINPLAWLAARRMCVERERACDDLVLDGGCKPSDYATQLLDIARTFRHQRFVTGIAMARSAQLQGRIAAIVDSSRARRPRPAAAVAALVFMAVLVACLAVTGGERRMVATETSALFQQQLAKLESFSRAKEAQSQALAANAGEKIAPDFQAFFDAATRGDLQTVTNRYVYFKQHHPQYVSGTNAIEHLRTPYWSPVLEICLAYDQLANGEPKYTQVLADGIINSIPPGSIYLGGTDPGRGVPTAFEKSSIDGDPFFCLTQNALADGTYLDYLRATYGGKIYTPTGDDSQRCFEEYVADATRRLNEKKLKPGEDVRAVDDRVQVSGQVAVMSINALLARLIFDKNPQREFYIEESFPLDWMYPHLEPHGLILKLNRQPQARLSEEVLAWDHEYWSRLVAGMIGDWLDGQKSVSDVAEFVERVYVRRDLTGFTGDPLFVQNDYARRTFSKLRSSIAGVYSWRLGGGLAGSNTLAEYKATAEAEKRRLIQEADFAFRQALALCPNSPEAVFRYVNFLLMLDRTHDAAIVAKAAMDVDPKESQFPDLLKRLREKEAKQDGQQ